ncbi:Rho GTPase-activating protein 24-like [Balamuthia mandrillaris]
MVGGAAAASVSAFYYYWWGAPSSTVFGKPLDKVATVPAGEEEEGLPLVLQQLFAALRKTGLTAEGLFRQPGSRAQVQQLRATIDAGQAVQLEAVEDPYLIADLLKLYLRELPEPLFPHSSCQQFLQVETSFRQTKDEETWLKETRALLTGLPLANRVTLRHLFSFLEEVAQVPSNRMDSTNLAIVFAPNLIYLAKASHSEVLLATPLFINLVQKCIEHCHRLFNGLAEDCELLSPSQLRRQSASSGTAADDLEDDWQNSDT